MTDAIRARADAARLEAMRPGVRGLLNRLSDSSAKIGQLERHLTAERRRRDLLLLKGVTAGLTTRELGRFGGISSPAVTYATRRARVVVSQPADPAEET